MRALVLLPGYYARVLASRLALGPRDRDETLRAEIAGYLAGLLTGWKYLPKRAFDVRPSGTPVSDDARPPVPAAPQTA